MFPVFLKLFVLISNMSKLQINFHTLSTTLKILSVLKMQSIPVVTFFPLFGFISEIGSQKFHKYSQEKTLKWLKKKVLCFSFTFRITLCLKSKCILACSYLCFEPCGIPQLNLGETYFAANAWVFMSKQYLLVFCVRYGVTALGNPSLQFIWAQGFSVLLAGIFLTCIMVAVPSE